MEQSASLYNDWNNYDYLSYLDSREYITEVQDPNQALNLGFYIPFEINSVFEYYGVDLSIIYAALNSFKSISQDSLSIHDEPFDYKKIVQIKRTPELVSPAKHTDENESKEKGETNIQIKREQPRSAWKTDVKDTSSRVQQNCVWRKKHHKFRQSKRNYYHGYRRKNYGQKYSNDWY
ncbi:unnamed protein product [Moneuplotes crassus]|uniref:Uncharacterized protein n=1 Tax=Euplotes crassus TaxID=5936 RepID=A0AAD2D2Y0_EUPCR|nr:unnamed protein product [Moneuplotes crassus]